jgi:hypothetical protein
VVACDPFFCAGAVPLCGAAPAGKHPVVVHRVAVSGWGKRIAAASLLWRPGPVRSLEPAMLHDGCCARHLVDSGLSCFIDASARPAFAAALKSIPTQPSAPSPTGMSSHRTSGPARTIHPIHSIHPIPPIPPIRRIPPTHPILATTACTPSPPTRRPDSRCLAVVLVMAFTRPTGRSAMLAGGLAC